MADPILQAQGLTVSAGPRSLVKDAAFTVPTNRVLGFIGPSGAGKSTLLKALNRLIELTPNLRVQGQVLFHGRPIYGPGTNPDALRARIGILFQQPVVFPKSIYQNVIFGVKHLGEIPRRALPETAERALREAALWDEVKDRLKQPALRLSVGQQQRLCLARALASNPEVILMDEPTSALDPRSTEAIEELMLRLKSHHTLVVVTHNLRQALKVTDELAFVGVRDGSGQVLCHGATAEVLENTRVTEIEEFLCCQ